MILGCATKDGTAEYSERFAKASQSASYRRFDKKTLSSFGVGTYLGTSEDDAAYEASIGLALSSGLNVIDTAVNYRHMRSERVIGKVLSTLITKGVIKREEVFISTKGGFLPFDQDAGVSGADYLSKTFVEPGLVDATEAEQFGHSLNPRFIEHQIAQSLKNLNLQTIDLYYLHNPETQLQHVARNTFMSRLEAAFIVLERAVSEGKIGAYGVATWDAFRIEERERKYLSLAELVQLAAKAAGGGEHHFKAVQLPLNLSHAEAIYLRDQPVPGKSERASLLNAAVQMKLGVFCSAPLDQGKLVRHLPSELQTQFPRLKSDAQRAAQFVRSCPAVIAALVGMKSVAHVKELLQLFETSPTPAENFIRLYEKSMKTLYSAN